MSLSLNKNLLGLCVAGATLASSAVVFSANPAQAASLTYNWSYNGLANTSGTLVVDNTTGLLSSIAGTVGGVSIVGLVSDGWSQNIFFGGGDYAGISFSFQNAQGGKWDLGQYQNILGDGVGFEIVTTLKGQNMGSYKGTLTYAEVPADPADPAAVPEPLTILGSITAAGFGVAFKRKKNSNKEE